jgi:rare lipoprotein A (peptidoglycan hydrolase)
VVRSRHRVAALGDTGSRAQWIALAADRASSATTTTVTTVPVAAFSATEAPREAVPPSTTTTVPPPVTTTTTTTTTTLPPAPQAEELGLASWYGAPPGTCASPYLSFGTVVTVTDLATGGSVRCTVDDREALNPGRVIDLSYATFSLLADPSTGLIEVRVSW